jgi:hypothetical protein
MYNRNLGLPKGFEEALLDALACDGARSHWTDEYIDIVFEWAQGALFDNVLLEQAVVGQLEIVDVKDGKPVFRRSPSSDDGGH